jgi:hypothetical protein
MVVVNLVVIDTLVFVGGLGVIGYMFWRYVNSRSRFTLLLLAVCCCAIFGQLLILFGLGLELFPANIIMSLLFIFYVLGTPLYCIVFTERLVLFKGAFPVWLHMEAWNLKKATVFFYTVAILFCWPIIVHAISPQVSEKNYWIDVYHFVGWGLWNTFLLITDLILSVVSLKQVVKLKNELNCGVTFSLEVQRMQKIHHTTCVVLLLLVFATDIWNVSRTFILVFSFQHPDQMDLNILGCSLICHVTFGFAFLVALGAFTRSSHNRSDRKSTVTRNVSNDITNNRKHSMKTDESQATATGRRVSPQTIPVIDASSVNQTEHSNAA